MIDNSLIELGLFIFCLASGAGVTYGKMKLNAHKNGNSNGSNNGHIGARLTDMEKSVAHKITKEGCKEAQAACHSVILPKIEAQSRVTNAISATLMGDMNMGGEPGLVQAVRDIAKSMESRDKTIHEIGEIIKKIRTHQVNGSGEK